MPPRHMDRETRNEKLEYIILENKCLGGIHVYSFVDKNLSIFFGKYGSWRYTLYSFVDKI